MKIVLDTNVFISGIFWTGPPYQILKAWKAGKVRIAMSEEILEEYSRVGKELCKKFPQVDLKPFLELLINEADLITTSGKLKVEVCKDPDDVKFIACAIASKASCIVSGDKHLLQISGFHGLQVFTPKAFVDKYLI